MSDADWVARGIAGGSAALSAVALYFSRFDGRWKRRHAALDPLRKALDDLAPAVYNPTDSVLVAALFTPATGADLVLLDEAVARIPDRRLRPKLKGVVEALNAVRSAQQPGGSTSLTPAQFKKLGGARSDLEWLRKRMDKAAQRGVA